MPERRRPRTIECRTSEPLLSWMALDVWLLRDSRLGAFRRVIIPASAVAYAGSHDLRPPLELVTGPDPRSGLLRPEQAIELFLLCEVERKYRVQPVEDAAQVSTIFRSGSICRQLRDEAAVEAREAMDLVMSLDERPRRVLVPQHAGDHGIGRLLLLALMREQLLFEQVARAL